MKDGQWAVMRLSDKTRTVLTIPVELKPDTDYELGLNADGYLAFASEDGDPLYPELIRFKNTESQQHPVTIKVY